MTQNIFLFRNVSKCCLSCKIPVDVWCQCTHTTSSGYMNSKTQTVFVLCTIYLASSHRIFITQIKTMVVFIVDLGYNYFYYFLFLYKTFITNESNREGTIKGGHPKNIISKQRYSNKAGIVVCSELCKKLYALISHKV